MQVDRAKAEDWLRSKWPHYPVCLMCGELRQEMSDTLMQLSPYNTPGAMSDPLGTSQPVPLLAVTCQNCGHTLLIDAKLAGQPPLEFGVVEP